MGSRRKKSGLNCFLFLLLVFYPAACYDKVEVWQYSSLAEFYQSDNAEIKQLLFPKITLDFIKMEYENILLFRYPKTATWDYALELSNYKTSYQFDDSEAYDFGVAATFYSDLDVCGVLSYVEN